MITIKEEIRNKYPEVLSLEQVRTILHISKRKTAWMLQNGIIRCEISQKKTRQYRIKMDDLVEYLERFERDDPSVLTPVGMFNAKKAKNPKPPKMPPHKKTYEKPSEDFRAWLEDEWYAESNMLLSQDIARITGYEHHTVQRWLKEKRIRSVWTQDALITSKTWLIEFYCEDAYKIVRKSDAHLELTNRFHGIT